jgi:uncharacterized protein (DUF305 family)
MKKTLVALVATAAVGAVGCGSDDAPSSAAKGNGTDRAFVAAMIPHHESAVKMAAIARGRGESNFVKELASNITDSQTEEIALMRTQDADLAKAGVKAGTLSVGQHMMGMDGDPATLQTANPFDAAFIKMMIPHHEGAIEMAREELDKGENPELLELAQNIIDAQQREVDQMIQHSKTGPEDSGGHSSHDG